MASGDLGRCPLILHSSMKNSPFFEYLESGYEVFYSNRIEPDSIMMPSCGLAVLVVHLIKVSLTDKKDLSNTCGNKDDEVKPEEDNATACNLTTNSKTTDNTCANPKLNPGTDDGDMETLDHLVSRINQFNRRHKVCVVLLVGLIFEEKWDGGKFLKALEKRLKLPSPLVLPTHLDQQIAMHIEFLSKACREETLPLVMGRIEERISRVLNTDFRKVLARCMGLKSREAYALLDGFESIPNVAAASKSDIYQYTTLSRSLSSTVYKFLCRDESIKYF